jgi:hypothetical protein
MSTFSKMLQAGSLFIQLFLAWRVFGAISRSWEDEYTHPDDPSIHWTENVRIAYYLERGKEAYIWFVISIILELISLIV